MELQDRGSPHVHLVLWTGKSADELLAMPDLVVAQIPQHADDEELYDLVLARQRHTCTNYCHNPRTEGQNCRFGFPFEEQREAYFDRVTKRATYKRSAVDGWINPYCPYLLKFLKVSMDIQVNYTGRVMYYLAKYMSKVDTTVNVQYGMEDMQTHFQARQLGAVDAAYYACGWNKHRSSRSTIYISAVFPGTDERRQLRPNLGSLRADDTNIFTKTHTEKYLNRHQQTAAMTFPEYFTVYMLSEEQDASDDILELGEERFGVYDRTSVANQIEQEVLDIRIGPLDANSEPGGLMRPVECVDNFKMRYRARLRKRLPLWRTHLYDQTTVEPFFIKWSYFINP